jgi:hypothetical protein
VFLPLVQQSCDLRPLAAWHAFSQSRAVDHTPSRRFSPRGAALVGSDAPVGCGYDPWVEFAHRHGTHDHVKRGWIPFLRRCVRPPRCEEPAVACAWWDSLHAGYYEAPVCARHLVLADQQNLLVPLGIGVELGPDGTWFLHPDAVFEPYG